MARNIDVELANAHLDGWPSGQSHNDGAGRKRALSDSKRSHDGVTRHPDHGPHDMGVPNPRTD